METSAPLSAKPTRVPGHLGYLDGVRALAAVYVVIAHQIIPVNGPEPLVKKLLNYPFWFSHYAVNLFIVLSGFCLMLPVVQNGGRLRGTAWLFYRRRAQRILPPYYLAMAVSLALIATVIGRQTGSRWDTCVPVTPFDFYTHLLLIHDVFERSTMKINGPLWSIAVEWRIYLLFPLILMAWHRWGALTTALVVVTVSTGVWWGLAGANIPDLNLSMAGLCPHYLGLFALGMLAAQLSFAPQPPYARLRIRLPWQALLALATLAVALVTHYKTAMPWVVADVVVGLWAGCLLVAVSIGRANRIKHLLSWPPLVFVGTFSFSIYLIHYPLNQLLLQYVVWPLGLGPVASTVFLLVVGTPLMVLGAYGFYRVAERPFIPAKRQTKSTAIPKQMLSGTN